MSARILKDDLPKMESLSSIWKTEEGFELPAQQLAVNSDFLKWESEKQKLEAQIELLIAESGRLRDKIEASYKEGLANGYEKAQSELNRHNAQITELFKSGLIEAMTDFKASLSRLERLSPAIASEALQNILGQDDTRLVLLMSIIKHQLKMVSAQAAVSVEVSSDDFTDGLKAAELERELSEFRIEIFISNKLKSGDCRIKLRLGALEVGLNQQWERLNIILRDFFEATSLQNE